MMSYSKGTLVRLIIVTAIAIVITYDLGVVASGYFQIDNNAAEVATAAALKYKSTNSRAQALAAAEVAAQDTGVVLVGFDIAGREARVRVRSVPVNTIVAYKITALRAHLITEAYSSVPID